MFYELDASGNAVFVGYDSSGFKVYDGKSSLTGWKLFKEIYAKNLFIVLRPTQLYGTTVNYEYNGAATIGDKSYVAYDIYRNLTTPSKGNTTIKLVYNGTSSESLEISNNLTGWYSDKTLTKK